MLTDQLSFVAKRIQYIAQGDNIAELKADLRQALAMLEEIAETPGSVSHNGHDTAEIEPPLPTRRRRSRDATAAPVEPEPEVEPEAEPEPGELRTKVIDILQTCYRHSKVGASKVVDLQKEYDVKRFAEVPDGKLSTLYRQATALQAELAGGAPPPPPAADTGPF